MNTEDKFYFGKHGQPERFARSYSGNSKKLNSGAVVASWDDGDAVQFANATQAQAFSDKHGLAGVYQSPSSRTFFVLASKSRSSRPGQPERFAISSSDLNYAKSQIRSATPERLREIEQELLTLAKSGDNNAKTLLAYLKSEWDERYRGTHSRPGQPERFDASSLDRGNFAEASSSPMLGKLLSEKQMPEGGWRAVETGGGALVISFEDGDVAGNFARRVAGSGYSATAPVQSIGRYWNVEVKNGK